MNLQCKCGRKKNDAKQRIRYHRVFDDNYGEGIQAMSHHRHLSMNERKKNTGPSYKKAKLASNSPGDRTFGFSGVLGTETEQYEQAGIFRPGG